MNIFQKIIFFLMGFTAITAFAVADDCMAESFGCAGMPDATEYARSAAAATHRFVKEAEKLGEFYGQYLKELSTAVVEEWERRTGQEDTASESAESGPTGDIAVFGPQAL